MKALLITTLIGLALSFGAQPFSATQTQPTGKPDELLKKLTPEEQSALGKSGESPNDRAKTYMRIGAARLKNARALLDQDKYSETDEQLEIYFAIIHDAGRFFSSVKPRDKAHKTLEQGLKEHLRLLESIKRDIPSAHFEVTDLAMKTAERVRIQALKSALSADDFLKTPNQQL
jgi:hypothetical protein